MAVVKKNIKIRHNSNSDAILGVAKAVAIATYANSQPREKNPSISMEKTKDLEKIFNDYGMELN